MGNHQAKILSAIVITSLTVLGCSSSNKNYVSARSPASDQVSKADDVVALVKGWIVDSDPKVGFVTTLAEIEKYGLEKAQTKEQPWSGSYWPDRLGGIAARYRQINQKISIVKKPSKNYRKFERLHAPFEKNYDQLTREQIRLASPAEKYDLLVGDRNFSFTKSVWSEVEYLNAKTPGVIFWSGICDGWTSSSLVLHRPRSTVEAVSPDGKVIDFYPDDLKALSSYLWAHQVLDGNANMEDGTPKLVNYGFRCFKRNPKRDKKGSVLDLGDGMFMRDADECRDINPGVWHLNIVNRIGVQGKGFVIDTDYDVAVNNHAVTAYSAKYFNPASGKQGNYQQAMIPIADYKNDPFAKKRNSDTRYIVGVAMDVTYMDYGMPIKGYAYDNESVDKTDVMPVIYDIELDANAKIIAGQWRVSHLQKKRDIRGFPKPRYPDFMWYQRAMVAAPGENLKTDSLANHDWTKPIPKSLQTLAIQDSKYELVTAFLSDRARFPKVDRKLRAAAIQSSNDNDAIWLKYCLAATGDQYCSALDESNPKSKLPEIIELKRLADAADADLEKMHHALDKIGIPRAKPYPQPLGSIIYGLFDAARVSNQSQSVKSAPMEEEASGQ